MNWPAGIGTIRAELAARPPFLLRCFERWIDILERQPKRFVELHGLQLLALASERRRVEPRLERRLVAIALVMGALLIDADLCSLRSGYRRGDGNFSGRGQKWIAELTGLSLGRIRRAIEDLTLAGYLTSTQPIEPYLGPGRAGRVGPELRYCAHNTIYRFEVRWFERISYDVRLKRERATAVRRRKERGRLYAATLVRARRSIRRARRAVVADVNAFTPPPARPRPPDTSR